MRNIHIKRLTALIAMALCVVALVGCGQAASLQRPTPTAGAVTVPVSGTCTISEDNGVITVTGTLDVMNGAWIDVSIVAQNSAILSHSTFQKTDEPISLQFTLTEEQMEGVVDIQGFICCAPSYYHKQSDEVYAAYGKKFENITALDENVVWTNEGVILVVASDWLYGLIPSPTPGPTTAPTATPEVSVSAEAATTPSA